MKILHVTFGLPPYASGGLPLYVNELIKSQKKLGHEPLVLEPGPIVSLRKKIYFIGRHNDIPVYRIPNALPVAYNFGVSEPNKYVSKPNGSKPGYVIFTHNKTIYVNPESEF